MNELAIKMWLLIDTTLTWISDRLTDAAEWTADLGASAGRRARRRIKRLMAR
jgi:hypothetical protein